MWFLRRRRSTDGKTSAKPGLTRRLRRLIVGFVIGGAIGSIIGTKLMDEKQCDHDKED